MYILPWFQNHQKLQYRSNYHIMGASGINAWEKRGTCPEAGWFSSYKCSPTAPPCNRKFLNFILLSTPLCPGFSIQIKYKARSTFLQNKLIDKTVCLHNIQKGCMEKVIFPVTPRYKRPFNILIDDRTWTTTVHIQMHHFVTKENL